MSSNRSIVLNFCFEGRLNQSSLVDFFLKFFEKYKFSFSEFDYTITDKSKEDWIQKSGGGKFSKRTLAKFKELENLKDDRITIDFELLRNTLNYEYKSQDIDVSVATDFEDEIKQLKIVLNDSWIDVLDIKSFAHEIIKFFHKSNSRIIYGYVFSMDNAKLPALFNEGISNEKLDPEENHLINLKSKYLSCNGEKVWNVFWANILSSNHISEATAFTIRDIVGTENFEIFENKTYWFNTDENLSTFTFANKNLVREQLKSLLDKESLLVK